MKKNYALKFSIQNPEVYVLCSSNENNKNSNTCRCMGAMCCFSLLLLLLRSKKKLIKYKSLMMIRKRCIRSTHNRNHPLCVCITEPTQPHNCMTIQRVHFDEEQFFFLSGFLLLFIENTKIYARIAIL